jgi:hypothetical protein
LEYTDEIIPNFSKEYHNELYYIYVKSFGKAERHSKSMRKNKEIGKKELKESHTIVNKDVLAFDDITQSHIKDINWDEMIRRNILDKAEKLFDVMKWDFSTFKPQKITKKQAMEELKKRGLL